MSEGESISSPTVLLEALFITLITGIYKERDVTTFHVPGAYLHADVPEGKTLLLNLWSCFINIICDINPEHKANVWYKRAQKVLYLRLLRSICRCIYSSLQWYTFYTDSLQKKVYLIKLYDLCVEKKIIEVQQGTIVWYVDEKKTSHVNSEIIEKLISGLKVQFGDIILTRGEKQ